ncbi:Spo0E like sporulation regulatory protein [Desulfotomaculum arcticum]|uniref:Spo0E like sporulation regulatory protein n=1 Tax=Desulfotruncus arcticus DSM 17038 TaxID=1121424 RepID=A0A1I2ZFD9_9FIRM|nr:aspartyl-phosphate phosphatase Spo0E family protein [Desulfotruncus arcticus]SFH36444.1 Spo0E like sporulation regulatory protein [Desulfotomaculum arcticum] [Desulfotruncus arcticus DSM 17038]
MENIDQKIESARLKLYSTKGSLISPEVVRASQELDEHIVAYYKQESTLFREEKQASA